MRDTMTRSGCIYELDMRDKEVRHVCMELGAFCMYNVMENPGSVLKYIRRKLRDVLRRL